MEPGSMPMGPGGVPADPDSMFLCRRTSSAGRSGAIFCQMPSAESLLTNVFFSMLRDMLARSPPTGPKWSVQFTSHKGQTAGARSQPSTARWNTFLPFLMMTPSPLKSSISHFWSMSVTFTSLTLTPPC